MVEARAAGVLFTVDPVSGRRGRAVIDAVPAIIIFMPIITRLAEPGHEAEQPRNHEQDLSPMAPHDTLLGFGQPRTAAVQPQG